MRKVKITKLTDPRYHLSPWQVRWRSSDGRRPARYFPKKSMAEKFAHLQWSRLNASIFGDIVDISWDELVEEYLAARKVEKLAPKTSLSYREALDDFKAANNNARGLTTSRISIHHIDLFKKYVSSNAAPTINKKLRSLRALFNWAKQRNYVATNYVLSSGMLKEDRKIKTIWTIEDLNKVLDTCRTIQNGDQWIILIYLAPLKRVGRKESIVGLAVSDFDLEEGTVKCFDQKTGSDRITPLHPKCLEAVKKYISALPKKQSRMFSCPFSNKTWRRIIESTDVSYLTFHHLRSCATTWLKKAGISESVAASVFGHGVEVSRKYYTALDDLETRRQAVQSLPLS